MDNNNKMSVVLETWFTGHRSEYIAHLMRFINSRPDLHGKYIFILNERLRSLLGELISSSNYSVEFIEINKHPRNYISKSFWEWNIVSQIISRRGNIGEIIFMDIDSNLILVSSPKFKKFNLTVKGILFQPYVHFEEIKGGFSFYIKKVFKNFLLQKFAVLLNSNIRKIFILNDKNTVNIMNKKIKPVFYNLPDPIENVNNGASDNFKNIIDKYGIKNNNKNLLVFGSIDYRKNLINIIDALRLLPSEIKKKVHLVIAGKIGTEMRDEYIPHIEKYKDEISISYNDTFVNAEEREPLFKSCDLVLMPYRNFYSASSVLGHAISYNKNVIAPNKGLLGKIVKENKIGIVVDPLNPAAIKEAINQVLSNPSKYAYDSKMLMEEYSAANFSKLILLN
ncbi:glycosyltransferase family 4 protein [Segetibacter koreensis]|uniref:glycosyltransferase family 4 protein n=1 Tax=Segetibacter koreensis TaxID=398037 RepID=UPI0003A496FC|nr:glycosyltransferase family 4 protein [Segetibacter koreensis]